jgi:hypothetical protein
LRQAVDLARANIGKKKGPATLVDVHGSGKSFVSTYEVEDNEENAVMSEMANIRDRTRRAYCGEQDEAMLFARNLGLTLVYIYRNKGRHLIPCLSTRRIVARRRGQ